MKRAGSWNEDAYTISSDDCSDSSEENDPHQQKLQNKDASTTTTNGIHLSKDALLRRAEIYQEYMRSIPIPIQRNSVIPFTSWNGLARALKQLYGQPLHYLTNTLLKQWDQMRVGSKEEHLPLDFVIHPSKAEALIWVAEEVHRITSSYSHLAELWTLDPMYHICVDPFVPQNIMDT